jgi:hypothetical protein
LDVAAALEQDQLAATRAVEHNLQKGGAVALPAVGKIAARSKDFVQKADHSLQSLLGIVRVFYGNHAGRQRFEGFTKLVSERYGESDPFSQFLVGVLPFLKFIRNARNCVEHPKDSQKIVARDFFSQADGTILPPTIEIIHPHASMRATPVSEFMSRVQEDLIVIVEQTIAFMCSKHLRPPMAAFPVQSWSGPKKIGGRNTCATHTVCMMPTVDPSGRHRHEASLGRRAILYPLVVALMRGRGERLSAVGRAPGDRRTGPPRIRRSRFRQIYGLLVLARERCRRRTPRPPPFSSINSTPLRLSAI